MLGLASDTVYARTSVLPQKQPGAMVYIYDSTGALASLFSDINGLIPLANPVVTDANGVYSFFVTPGTYNLTISATGFYDQKAQITVLAFASAGISTVTVSTLLTSANSVTFCDDSSGPITVTMPVVVLGTYVIEKIGNNANVVTINNSDGSLFTTLVLQGECVTIVGDGAVWRIVH